MSDQTLDACPHCGAGVLIMDNGKQCRAASGAWVTFACLTSIHQGHDPRMSQSRKCEEAERNGLIMEVATLRTANKALVERVKRLEGALRALLDRDQRNTCRHEDTHCGAIWEVCNQCGVSWADDEGGKPEWEDPEEWTVAENLLKETKP